MSLRAIKAVAVDVDGTLLDSDHRLREAVKDALCNLAANDIRVVLATARGPKALGPIIRPLQLSALLICFSGAWVGEIDGELLTPKSAVMDTRRINSDGHFTASPARTALKNSHLACNDITIICETVH